MSTPSKESPSPPPKNGGASPSPSAYPRLVGIDWSILSVMESNAQEEIEEPLAEISLQTDGPTEGQQLEVLKFLCNKNQLQDFHAKVKEAANFLQKLAPTTTTTTGQTKSSTK